MDTSRAASGQSIILNLIWFGKKGREEVFMRGNILTVSIFVCCTLLYSYQTELAGDPADVQTQTEQGSVLMGGGSDVADAFRWMIDKSGGGDFVVIRYNSLGGYTDWIKGLGDLNSVETIAFENDNEAVNQELVDKIRNAEALWMAGGNQGNYVDGWKDTPVEEAINYLINEKKCPVGGTSAGCAVMTPVYWGATSGSWPQNTGAEEALTNPVQSGRNGIGFNDFLMPPFLENTISDQHYMQRSRQYRHIAMMAYIHSEGCAPVKGIGCNEATAVCIGPGGKAVVYGSRNDSYAFFIKQYCAGPEIYQDNQPLTWRGGFKVYKALGNSDGNHFMDLADWETTDGSGEELYWYVDNGTLHEETSPYEPCAVKSRTPAARHTQDTQLSIWHNKSGIVLRFFNSGDAVSGFVKIVDMRGRQIFHAMLPDVNKGWNCNVLNATRLPADLSGRCVILSLGVGKKTFSSRFITELR
ncbi:MAG: hypothetical protein GF350_05445 [Chitinivibrionales bacterium]|nr:hypothetical protein [Chitinivibrionales bacterium]